MRQHVESVHKGNKLFKCTICVHSFEQESSIHQHKEYDHESNAPYKCELCNEGFDGFFFQ